MSDMPKTALDVLHEMIVELENEIDVRGDDLDALNMQKIDLMLVAIKTLAGEYNFNPDTITISKAELEGMRRKPDDYSKTANPSLYRAIDNSHNELINELLERGK